MNRLPTYNLQWRDRLRSDRRGLLAFEAGWLVLFAISMPFLHGCIGKNASLDSGKNKNVALVNGEPITLEEFQQSLSEAREDGVSFLPDNETARRVKRDLIERLIDTRLLIQEARRKKLSVDPQVIDTAMKLAAARYPNGQLQVELVKKGKSIELYRRDTENSYLINLLIKQEVVDRIAISMEEIKKYYQTHQQQLMKPEEVRVRQIVARTEESAKELRQQILQGAAFEELAKKHSLGPEGQNGGDLGYFPKGRMPPSIEQACFELQPSRVSQVVSSPYGFHLFQLIDRRSARMPTMEEARAEIVNILTDDKEREAENFYLRFLREAARIERDDTLLEWVH